MKEAKKNGVYGLPEETTLVQLIFGGYLRSKVFFTKHSTFPSLKL
jgi:ubiquitin carboxyl-terminal hydrolase 36/42